MVVLQDVTEERHARDELERERHVATMLSALGQEFRTLAEHSPDCICRLDPNGRYLYVNQSAADLAGVPAERWVGRTLAEVGVAERIAAVWSQAARTVIDTRAPYDFDTQIPLRNGEGHARSLHVRYLPELAEDGALVSVLGIATDVSALKQAQARLAEQASELEAVFEAISDGVVVYDREGRMVRANRARRLMFQALAALNDWSADPSFAALPFSEQVERWQQAAPGRAFALRAVDGQAIPLEQTPTYRALQGETVTGANAVDERFDGPDGRGYVVSVSAAPLRDASGQVVGAVGVTHDVTAHRALVRQMAEQARDLETIFEAQADGVAVFDLAGRFMRANAALRTLLGIQTPEDDYLILPLAERAQRIQVFDETGAPLPAERWPHWRALAGETFAGAEAVEVLIHTLDGRDVWAMVSGGPMRATDGQITGAVLVYHDVTAHRALERQVAEQERQFRTLVENTPDVIARFDRQLRYLYVNPAITQVGPTPPERYIGKTNADLGWPEAAYSEAHRAIAHVFATGESQTLEESEASWRDPTTARTFRAQVLPERAADGRVESVLTVTTEITELKRTEQALREANAALETARQEEARRKQIAETLRGALAILNSARLTQQVLQEIVRQPAALFGATAAVIYSPEQLTESLPTDESSSSFQIRAVHGLRLGGRHARLGQRLPFADTAAHLALTSLQPIALVAVRDAPAPAPASASSGEASGEASGAAIQERQAQTRGRAVNAEGVIITVAQDLPSRYQALLALPIHARDRLYGCLLLFYAQPHRFDAEDVALAQAYADQTALAIANAQLQTQREQEATAAERTRLARELHDTVNQEIFSANLIAESLPKVWLTHRDQAEVEIGRLHTLTTSALAGLRALQLELRPSALEQSSLAQALRQLGVAMANRAQAPVAVEVEDVAEAELLLPPEVKVAFYRVAQEALMNAAKYAQAQAIHMRLRSLSASRWELEVVDDGQGFDPTTVPAGHFGLGIMRERAQHAGAQVQVRSQVGQGTRVLMTWVTGHKAASAQPVEPPVETAVEGESGVPDNNGSRSRTDQR
jgi:PAS domain S-box-containing protein